MAYQERIATDLRTPQRQALLPHQLRRKFGEFSTSTYGAEVTVIVQFVCKFRKLTMPVY